MELQELLTSKSVFRYEERSDDKLEFMKDMLGRTLKGTPMEANLEKIWEGLREREVSMSTGIGLGVAIPHCSSEWVDDVIVSLAVLGSPLEFQAVDDEPVQIVVLLLMPRNRFDRHIKTLASIARMFNDEGFRQKIVGATDEEQIFELIQSFQDPTKEQ
ncbi:MAG TPA: PTS sugar transporter subunit IIA [Leptospiraceae bacterium]|nr:PTS sugar transporter subunit IIA [Spirochaetaceae bacterium]HBS04932.1 PTS sugar transporter subunit IIA [Leptospiraceae bacterium]|tara:strand:- start:47380 stop:47856 length:477 start_codon:yes stop_codon:yes gene_type:complete